MIEVHRVGAADWERVRAIRLRALRDAPDAFWDDVADEEAVTEAQWRQRLSAAEHATFVATADGADVGLVVTGPSSVAPNDTGLHAMWVAQPARGTGVADVLVRAAVAWGRAEGYGRMRLWVNDTNVAAARLYERHGFVPTGMVGTFRPPREHLTEHERALDL